MCAIDGHAPNLSMRIRSACDVHEPGCGDYSDIQIYLNIFRYEYSFVSYSYHFFDTNIFGYSFVKHLYIYLFIFDRIIFSYEHIRIFVGIVF